MGGRLVKGTIRRRKGSLLLRSVLSTKDGEWHIPNKEEVLTRP